MQNILHIWYDSDPKRLLQLVKHLTGRNIYFPTYAGFIYQLSVRWIQCVKLFTASFYNKRTTEEPTTIQTIAITIFLIECNSLPAITTKWPLFFNPTPFSSFIRPKISVSNKVKYHDKQIPDYKSDFLILSHKKSNYTALTESATTSSQKGISRSKRISHWLSTG